jgi:hypothetical protein
VAADIHYEIHTDRGAEILDELEQRTGQMPYLESTAERRYSLTAEDVGPDGFDAMLDRISSDWRVRSGASRRNWVKPRRAARAHPRAARTRSLSRPSSAAGPSRRRVGAR